MHSVKINRIELMDIVKKNKDKHVDAYTEAVEDYKAAVLKLTKDNLNLAKTQDLKNFVKIKPLPNAPISYEPSYNRAIRMLELSVDEVIEVEEEVFNQLVLDEWSWKNSFMMTNSTYKAII
jgi:hypothetical protein